MKRTYEILGYKTKEDFEKKYSFEIIGEGISIKREAIKIAKKLFKRKHFSVIKLQSNDREFIQILDKHKGFKEDDY